MHTEDIIDCLKVTLGDVYDCVFLFDSSSGHAKKRIDGLDVKEMNKSWHSKPSGARNTKIEQQDGYLGPYYDENNPAMVRIGEEQTMDYTSNRDKEFGPFWLTAEEREQQRTTERLQYRLKRGNN